MQYKQILLWNSDHILNILRINNIIIYFDQINVMFILSISYFGTMSRYYKDYKDFTIDACKI